MVPMSGITTFSALTGTCPRLQLAAVAQEPPAGLIQVFVVGVVRSSNASSEGLDTRALLRGARPRACQDRKRDRRERRRADIRRTPVDVQGWVRRMRVGRKGLARAASARVPRPSPIGTGYHQDPSIGCLQCLSPN